MKNHVGPKNVFIAKKKTCGNRTVLKKTSAQLTDECICCANFVFLTTLWGVLKAGPELLHWFSVLSIGGDTFWYFLVFAFGRLHLFRTLWYALLVFAFGICILGICFWYALCDNWSVGGPLERV